MNIEFYDMIFKRKSFHLFRNIGNEKITPWELEKIEETFYNLKPLVNNIKTKIVWWNFNSRNQTVTFLSENDRCIYLSGYSPILLKYLESGFNGEQFLDNLLNEYAKNINK